LQGDFDKAAYHYKRALQLDPKNDIIRINIVKLEQLRKRFRSDVP